MICFGVPNQKTPKDDEFDEESVKPWRNHKFEQESEMARESKRRGVNAEGKHDHVRR